MDGLVCATLLKHLGLIKETIFVHPKDMQDGKIAVTSKDITTNLPYVQGVYLAFDHHFSESIRNEKATNHIIDVKAASAADVVYRYYGAQQRFPKHFKEMMDAANKADSAAFEIEDILHPKGWELLSFLMDSRTGLGRFRDFKITNHQLLMDLIDYCGKYSVEEILQIDDVKERVDLYFEYEQQFIEQLKRCSTIHGNLVIIDYREEQIIYPGNRFMIYALYPEVNISIHAVWGKDKQNVVYSTGKSIINKTSKTNVGELMLRFGGGGHQAAGGCQPSLEEANSVLQELIKQINKDG